MLLQLFWKVHTRMGRCRMNSFKVCASRIMLSAQMFLDFLAISVWYACFSRKNFGYFPSLIIDGNSFSFCILYLKGLMGIDIKYTHQVQLKYKSVSLHTLVRRRKKLFQIFLVSESFVSFPETKQFTTEENAFLRKTGQNTLYCSACAESAIEN